MRFPRSSGILLHPTSLPGRFGIGDLGPGAHRFVDFLADSGQRVWQVLPLGPTGYGDSPYQCFSAMAGNPLLISPERLVELGWLDRSALDEVPSFPADEVDFACVIPWKTAVLERAARNFLEHASAEDSARFQAFRENHRDWLPDFSLFMALKRHDRGAVWTQWDPATRSRDKQALAEWRKKLSAPIAVQEFLQFAFFTQ